MKKNKWLIINGHEDNGVSRAYITKEKYDYFEIKQYIHNEYCNPDEEAWYWEDEDDFKAGGFRYYESQESSSKAEFKAIMINDEFKLEKLLKG